MKVSLLVPSLASNGIARAWILAKLLERHYEVETIGWLRDDEEVFPWFAHYDWGVVRAPTMREGMREMERQISGDLVVAYAMSMMSFGVGLSAKARRGLPLVLDMGEWEVHDHWKRHGLQRGLMIARELLGRGWSAPHSFKYRYVLDQMTPWADEKLVACSFLAERYGGVVLPQGADLEVFDPARFDRAAVRAERGIPMDATVVFFGGNPMANKGLEETVAAIRNLRDRVDARLVIAGRDETHPYTRKLVESAPDRVIALGPQPFPKMPELLAMADLVTLPQTRAEPKSLGYVPCKIYEAMAMEIPCISTALSDLPEILDGCGYIVPPDDTAALQSCIERVLIHPEEARALGRRARERVRERYSWPVMEGILVDALEKLIDRTPRLAAIREAA